MKTGDRVGIMTIGARIWDREGGECWPASNGINVFHWNEIPDCLQFVEGSLIERFIRRLPPVFEILLLLAVASVFVARLPYQEKGECSTQVRCHLDGPVASSSHADSISQGEALARHSRVGHECK